MTLKRIVSLLLMSFVLTACALLSPGGDQPAPDLTPEPDQPTATPRPDQPDGAVTGFLGAWDNNDYQTMYGFLSSRSQQETPLDSFVAFYTDVDQTLGLAGIDYTIDAPTLSALNSFSGRENV